MVEVLEKKPVTLGALADRLAKLEKSSELVSIQQKVKDFAIKFRKLNKSQETKLIEELRNLEIPRFTEEHIATIANTLPKNIVELKTIFAGSKTTITEENLEKILQVIKANEK